MEIRAESQLYIINIRTLRITYIGRMISFTISTHGKCDQQKVR